MLMCALFVNVVFTSVLERTGAPPTSGFYCSTKLHFVYPEYGDMYFLHTVDTCYPIYMTFTLKMEATSAFETHQTNLPSIRVHVTENLNFLILELFTQDQWRTQNFFSGWSNKFI